MQNLNSSLIVHRLASNRDGRDFVIGDLHGCRPALDALLAEAEFDPVRDRLFSVGDLIDRGPDSRGCLALLDAPWFFATRGNHEQMFCDAVRSITEETTESTWEMDVCLQNGGSWAVPSYETRDPWLWEMAHRLEQLPHLMIVGEGASRFHVLHAEIWSALEDISDEWIDQHVADDERMAERLLWSRGLMIESPPPPTPEGLSPVYCGHTPQQAVKRCYGHINLDTGCYIPFLTGRKMNGTAGLTLTQAGTDRFWFYNGDRLIDQA